MTATPAHPPVPSWTAAALRRLPPEQRDVILAAAAEAAAEEYRLNPNLTAFEAFGEEESHGDSADAEPR